MKRPLGMIVTIALVLGQLALLAPRVAAFDWGGALDNRTSVTVTASDPANVFPEQKDRLTLWLELDSGAAGSLFAQGSYTLLVDPLVQRYLLFDLDALRYEVRLFSILNLSAGRLGMADFSRYILNDVLDGLQLEMNLPWSVITAHVGTSALRFIPNTTIVMSGNDASDAADPDKLLAPPRLIEGLQAVFPELLLRQDLTVSVVLQQDLRSEVIQEGGTYVPGGPIDGPLHTQYYGLGLSGPMGASLYYKLFGYLETGSALADSGAGVYERETLLGGVGGLELAYYLPKVLRSRLALSALYSSELIPISQPTFTLVYSPRLGDLLKTELSYSLKPFAGSAKRWLREMQGELTAAAYLQTEDFGYSGVEIDATVNHRPFSDLGAALTLGLYLPAAGAPQVGGRFAFSLSF